MPPQTMGAMMGVMHTIGTDTIYSFVIIFVSLMIYFATKELYELSQHKGIKYFRLAFLFFALAYTFRFLAQFIVLSLGHPRTFTTNLGAISITSLLLFTYASTSAIFYLWASNHWRWFAKPHSSFLLHAIALAISFISIITQNTFLLLVIQLVLVIVLAFTFYNKKKSKQSLHALYVLLAIFWALNLIDMLLPNFFFQVQIIIYLASIGLFLILLQRVIKKTQ